MNWESEVTSAINAWAPRYGISIDPALVHAIIEKETRHGALPLIAAEPNGTRSYGPMMVDDQTASSVLNVSDPASLQDPATGIYYGVQYLGHLMKLFPTDIDRAIAAYNAGPGNSTRKSNGTFINQQYVVDVLSFWNRFKRAAVAAAPVVGGASLLLAIGAIVLYFFVLRGSKRRAASRT
jgi:soluble lytic murein transglycosylase-like protein